MRVGDELSSREVAAILGLSERAVLYTVERGELRATSVRKGKKRYWRFSRNDVMAYKRSLEEPGSESEV